METDQAAPEIEADKIFSLLDTYNITSCEDIKFLTRVALSVEQRTNRWRRRTRHGLTLGLEMNRLAAEDSLHKLSVDPVQLAAAILAHDFGMGFLPLDLIEKPGQLNASEKKIMRTHIRSASDLVHRLKRWPGAREMVLAHHEKVDGTGYPNRLSEHEICQGAKILAIVDAFTAQGHKQIMHGVMEINRHTASHFCAKWVDYFNLASRTIFVHRAA